MQRRKSAALGAGLATVLVWVALVSALGLGLAEMATQHVSMQSRHSQRDEALLLARSAVSEAIAKIMSDVSYAKTPVEGQVIRVELAGCQRGALGTLCFHPKDAKNLEIPPSLNNLEGTESLADEQGQPVAAAQAKLIAIGKSGSATRQVVCHLAVPPFPYSLAAAGAVLARGGVTIGALKAVPEGPLGAETKLFPANLLSNNSSDQAVLLGANTRIAGDVRSAGQVRKDPTAPQNSIVIEGLIKSNIAPEKIPDIDFSKYDPQATNKPFSEVTSDSLDGLIVDSVNRREGNLVVNGDLQLKGGALYVNGDLHVRGNFSGKGIVVATGKVQLDGQAGLVAGNGAALLAGKDLSIRGGGPLGSYFQGLVYTKGNFLADKVTVVGTLISAGKESDPVTLQESRILEPPSQGPTTVVAPGTTGSGGSTASPDLSCSVEVSCDTPHLEKSYFVEVYGNELVVSRENLAQGQTSSTTLPGRVTIAIRNLTTTPQLSVGELQGLIYNDALGSQVAQFQAQGLTIIIRDSILGQINGNAALVAALTHPPSSAGTTGSATVITVDPSQFLLLKDKVRVAYWKESE